MPRTGLVTYRHFARDALSFPLTFPLALDVAKARERMEEVLKTGKPTDRLAFQEDFYTLQDGSF